VFTPPEGRALASLQENCLTFRPRQRILRRDRPQEGALYLSEGFVGRYRGDRFGRRQLLGLQIPGDYVDLGGFLLGHADHDLEALGEVVTRAIPDLCLQALEAEAPDILRKLWRISLTDAAIHRYWIFRLGRLAGRARIASFFCEMLLRLHSRGLCALDRFDLPITQVDLAEACGMTPVHANRMLGELRDEGICTFSHGAVHIADLPGLIQTGQYSWSYLSLAPELDREIQEKVSGWHGHQSSLPDTARPARAAQAS